MCNLRVALTCFIGSAGVAMGPLAMASAPVTTFTSDAAPVKLASGHNVFALYRTLNNVTGHVAPGTLLPRVRVAPSDFPEAFHGLWGADDGQLGVWLSPAGYLQFSPSSIYVGSSYFGNATLPTQDPPFEKTGSLPMEAGDRFELVMGDVIGNAPLPGDLERETANGQLAWDYAASTQRLTASYGGAGGVSDALFFRADIVARGGDVDARSTAMQLPPLIINLPPGASTGKVSYLVAEIFPYTHYNNFTFRIVPGSNSAVLTASVHSYISRAREYELPQGGQMNEWHLPIIGVVTVTAAGASVPQGVAFMGPAAGDALVSASGAGTTQTLRVTKGCSVAAGAELSPIVLGTTVGPGAVNEQMVPGPAAPGTPTADRSADTTSSLGVPRDQARMTREFAAAEAIGPLIGSSTELTLAGGRYTVTLDPDYRGEGILALRSLKRSTDGATISTVSSVPFVLLDGKSVALDRSRLIDLRVIPTSNGLGVAVTGGSAGSLPTPTIEHDLRADDPRGGHIDAVYTLGQGRYAFLNFELKQSDSFDLGHVLVTAVARSLSRDPVQASFIQYGELPEMGPVNYDGSAHNTEFSAPLDVLGNYKSLLARDHVVQATLSSVGHDGIITVLRAPAALTATPAPDPAISIADQKVGYYYSSADFASNFSAVTTQLTRDVMGYPTPPILGRSCNAPQVVDSPAVPDGPPALDIEKAWFDSDAINLYASIQVAALPPAAPAGAAYSWALHWRYADSGSYARASLDSDGKWSFDFGDFNGGYVHIADVAGETALGASGVVRLTIPRTLMNIVDGDLLRDTGAHSYIVTAENSEEVDQAPNAANANFGSGGDYLVGPSCAPPLLGVVSRKAHGEAGTFDVDLPLTGNPGVECRSGGANGDYTLVFIFANTLTSVGGARVTSGTGSVSSSSIGADAHHYIVNLTGVTNAQTITASLTNVTDSAGNASSALAAAISVLVADTTADRVVNSADISETKSQSGMTVSNFNYREDLNADGSINSADIAFVKSKSGTALP